MLVAAACVVYFITLALRLLDSAAFLDLARGSVQVLYAALFLYAIPVLFLVLYVLSLITLRLTYNEEGLELRSLFRRFRASWAEVRHAFVINRNLHVATRRGSFKLPLSMFRGDLESLRAFIPGERWLEGEAARRLRLRKLLPYLIGCILLALLLLIFLQRYLNSLLQAM